MDVSELIAVRKLISRLLNDRDDPHPVDDSESLFISGRLDSLAAVELVAFLEESFAIDFAASDFAIERIDSVDAIAHLVGGSRR